MYGFFNNSQRSNNQNNCSKENLDRISEKLIRGDLVSYKILGSGLSDFAQPLTLQS